MTVTFDTIGNAVPSRSAGERPDVEGKVCSVVIDNVRRFIRQTREGYPIHREYARMRKRYNRSRQRYYAAARAVVPAEQDALVSIVIPCFNTKPRYFDPLLDSVLAQGYRNWELVLADGSTDPQASSYLAQRASTDPRIVYAKIGNKGIAGNTNEAFSRATGEFIALMDHDDTLDPDALAATVAVFAQSPDTDLVYSDEDKLSDDGRTYLDPHLKPGFSLDLLRNVNYINHLVVVRRGLVEQVGGIREGFDGAQDHDFLLRICDQPGVVIRHVPKVLYHWRQAQGSTAANFSNKSGVTQAGVRALSDHLRRRGRSDVEPYAIENRPGAYGMRFQLPQNQLQIVLEVAHLGLDPDDHRALVEAYESNADVRRFGIDVVVDSVPTPGDLVVSGPFIPESESTPIAGLFGIAAEDGVRAVSGRLMRDGHIHDMGVVVNGTDRHHLFRGLSSRTPVPFGSTEWVRNVDEVSPTVFIEGRGGAGGRTVIWTPAVFVGLPTTSARRIATSEFYNPNLVEVTRMPVPQ